MLKRKDDGELLLQNSFTFWISRLANLMQEEFNRSLKQEDVSWPQWMVLNILCQEGTATPAHIAQQIGIDRSAVTRLLDRLEKKDLVRREHDRLDRRSVKVHLTPAGEERTPRLNELAQRHQEYFLNSLHNTEHRSFKGNIQKMLKLGEIDSVRIWKQ